MISKATIPAWFEEAVCASTDPALFFPDQGESVKPAKRICKSCPVVAECLAWAIAEGALYGIWGGTTAFDRRGLRQCRRCESLAMKGSKFCGPECRSAARAETQARYEARRNVA